MRISADISADIRSICYFADNIESGADIRGLSADNERGISPVCLLKILWTFLESYSKR